MLCGRSTGQIATTFARSMPAAGARAATRSAKLPPSEWPTRNVRGARMRGDDRAHRADDLVDAARVEQLAIQRERLAVIAKIQAKHVEARVVEPAADGQNVTRLGAALPAMQQNREPAARRPAAGCSGPSSRTPAPQSTISSRAAASSARRAPPQPALPQRPAREQRLHVAVAQPGGRVESTLALCGERSHRNRLWRRTGDRAVKVGRILLHPAGQAGRIVVCSKATSAAITITTNRSNDSSTSTSGLKRRYLDRDGRASPRL